MRTEKNFVVLTKNKNSELNVVGHVQMEGNV